MRRDQFPGTVGLIDSDLNLLSRVTRARRRAVQHEDLDEVRAMLEILAHRFANLVRAVEHPARRAVAIRGGDAPCRAEEARAGHPTRVDRLPEGDVIPVHLGDDALRRDAGFEIKPQIVRCAGSLQRVWFCQPFQLSEETPLAGVDRQVGMRVHEARQDRLVAEVDDFRAVRNAEIRLAPDCLDVTILDEDHGVVHRLRPCTINQQRTLDRDCHAARLIPFLAYPSRLCACARWFERWTNS